MKIDYASKFMVKEQGDIMHLFLLYQIIELQLFLILYSPEESLKLNRTEALEDMNEKFNFKTLGKLIRRYNNKFPNDEYNLTKDLGDITIQRNHFMHAFFMYIASKDSKKEAFKEGNFLLKNYIKKAEKVLNEKIPKLLTN